jgi:hypothetical protein
MENEFEDLLVSCSAIDFGTVSLSNDEKEFCRDLNNEIILLCKSLPESAQTDALLFLMKYSRISFGEDLNFLKYYYVPAWSILYWLIQSCPGEKRLGPIDIKNAKTAHAMAMFLHSLDDHLNDHELAVTHLALLLRSQSWMIMNDALSSLADGVDGGKEVIRSLIDNYYSSACGSADVKSLDRYCDLFKKLMAMGLIVPALMIKKMMANEEFGGAIQAAYASFGVAWRLLDDIHDIEKDLMKGTHSSIFACLPEEIRNSWDGNREEKKDKDTGYTKLVWSYVLEHSVIDRIKGRMGSELESAASIADYCNLAGLADEFRSLLRPLRSY